MERIGAAIKGGHQCILEFSGKVLGESIAPSPEAIDAAANAGRPRFWPKKWGERELFPSLNSGHGAAGNGHLCSRVDDKFDIPK